MCFAQGIFAADNITLDLFPQGAPMSNGLEGEEMVDEVGRISNVTNPRIIVSLPDEDKATGQAVVICPGGGYGRLAAENEGYQVAEWLNMRGIAAVLLIYRMPNGVHEIPLIDAKRAIELVRENSQRWNINPDQVGIMGFSAGGHLAATALTQYDSPENRPSFGILIYPVISFDDKNCSIHKGTRRSLLGEDKMNDEQLIEKYSCELHVSAQTPPTYISLGADDASVPPINSFVFANAMIKAGADVELHLYPEGIHGFGFGTYRQFKYRGEMEVNLDRWIKEQKK